MANVKYYIKESKNGKCPIMSVYYFNSKRLYYTTVEKLPAKNWNSEKGRVRVTRDFKRANNINIYLDTLAGQIKDTLHTEFKIKGINPSMIQFKDRLNLITGRTKDDKPKTFFDFVDKFINQRSKQIDKYSPATIKNYKVVKKRIQDCFPKLDFQEVTFDLYENLIQKLRETYSINYTGNIV